MRKQSKAWTGLAAMALIRELATALEPEGFGVGLAGSVLTEGSSDNDLDVIVFPLSTGKVDMTSAYFAIRNAGLVPKAKRAAVAAIWERKGSVDTKHVERWMYDGKAVDLFFLR